MTKPIEIAVAGALGRMGRSVIEQAEKDSGYRIAVGLLAVGAKHTSSAERNLAAGIHYSETLDAAVEVFIDFTLASGTRAWLPVCIAKQLPMIIGSTGHDESTVRSIEAAARTIPIVRASNFSTGITVLIELVGELAKRLGVEYDVEIVEAHHRHKADAPSGTALSLAESISNQTQARRLVYGRQGQTGERPGGEIGMHSLRMGDVVGQHEIHFSGKGETISIRHSAHSRAAFAAGALRAARWIVGRPPGLYSMRDVLGY